MPVRSRATAPPSGRPPAPPKARPPAPARSRPLLFRFDAGLSKAEQTRRQTQWVVLITLVTLVLIAVVGGIGVYLNAIRGPSLPVAVVNGDPIRRDTWQHYQALLTAELQGKGQQLQASQASSTDPAAVARQQAELNSIQQELNGVGDQAVNDLIDARIVAGAIPALEKAGAPAATIVPTSAQVDSALVKEKTLLGVTTPGQYQQALSALGLTDSALRGILTVRLEEDNITAYLSRDVQPVQRQVKARIMSFGDRAKAAAALASLRGGKSWSDVNSQYQKDAAAKETSRDVAWTPKGLEDATFDQFAFTAQPFQISDVLSDRGSYEIIQVEDVGPARPLTADQLEAVKTTLYRAWLDAQTEQANVQRYPQNMGK